MFRFFVPRIFLLMFVMPAQAMDAPRVVVSIAPIHSLVAGVMKGVAQPELLVKGNSSPHGTMLKPSQVRRLQQADVIVWVGESMDGFLVRPLANFDDAKTIIALMDVKGMRLLDAREGGVWPSVHDEDISEGHHDHGETDGHLWLDPSNAKIIVMTLVEKLSEVDPQHADSYRANGQRLQEKLTELDQQLKQKLVAVSQIPYLVFHDAYHYFERAYDLNPVGAIVVDLDHKPGAKRLIQIRQRVQAVNARCVFSEPQFSDKLIQVVIEGAHINNATLDPMGKGLEIGESLYFDLMRNLGQSLVECLES